MLVKQSLQQGPPTGDKGKLKGMQSKKQETPFLLSYLLAKTVCPLPQSASQRPQIFQAFPKHLTLTPACGAVMEGGPVQTFSIEIQQTKQNVQPPVHTLVGLAYTGGKQHSKQKQNTRIISPGAGKRSMQ